MGKTFVFLMLMRIICISIQCEMDGKAEGITNLKVITQHKSTVTMREWLLPGNLKSLWKNWNTTNRALMKMWFAPRFHSSDFITYRNYSTIKVKSFWDIVRCEGKNKFFRISYEYDRFLYKKVHSHAYVCKIFYKISHTICRRSLWM